MINSKRNIVWIASYPKSGNTWFRLLLNSALNPENAKVDINKLDSDTLFMAGNRKIFDTISGTNSSDLTFKEINLIRPQIYRLLAMESESNLYLKVHDAWQANDNSSELFPSDVTRGVVLIVRNPFDLAVSFANHSDITIKESIETLNNVDFCLESNESKLHPQLSQYISSWSEHYKSWFERSGLTVFVIRYEDLLANPIQIFSEALDFLGIEIDHNQIVSSVDKCSLKALQNQEQEFGFNEKPIKSNTFFRMGKSNYWEGHLNSTDIKSLVDNHYETLQSLDYLKYIFK